MFLQDLKFYIKDEFMKTLQILRNCFFPQNRLPSAKHMGGGGVLVGQIVIYIIDHFFFTPFQM